MDQVGDTPIAILRDSRCRLVLSDGGPASTAGPRRRAGYLPASDLTVETSSASSLGPIPATSSVPSFAITAQ